MEIAQPALIAKIPGLQAPLIARSGGHTYSHTDISGNARVHFGDVFNVSSDRTESAKEQPFTVPFCRDENFIPRGTVVEDLLKKVDVKRHTRAALYGLGGVGKTQIAIEFAYSYRDAHPNAAVFWLFAGTPERLLESLRRIAADLELPGHNDQGTDVISLVLRYLEDFRHGAWLLVVDNLDDNIAPKEAADGCESTIIQNIPQTHGCMVLVTTRDKRIAQTVTGNWSSAIMVDTMTSDDAALLLETRLPQASLRTFCQAELLKELDFLPLAISQAGAYMLHRQMDTTLYLQLLKMDHQSILSSSSSKPQNIDVSRDKSQANAVIKSIQLTIARLSEECSSAESLLMIMATYDGQSIPRYFLDEMTVSDATEPGVDRLVAILCNLSLLRIDVAATGYSMHKLVRAATQDSIIRNGHHDIIDKAAVMLLGLWPSSIGAHDWLRKCELLNHAHEIVFGFGHSMLDELSRARLLEHIGSHLLATFRFSEARDALRAAESCLQRLPREHHEDVASRVLFTLPKALLGVDSCDAEGLALLRSSVEADKQRGLQEVHRYLSSLNTLTLRTAAGSLSANQDLEALLLQVDGWCRQLGDDDNDKRKAKGVMYHNLSTVYLKRFQNWELWIYEAGPDLKDCSVKYWLSRATDTARKAHTELQALTTFDLTDCNELMSAAAALGDAFIWADQYREAGWCMRHALCVSLNLPHDRLMAPVLQLINIVQDLFGEPRVTKESFAAEHKDCRMGPHGCRFFAAELD